MSSRAIGTAFSILAILAASCGDPSTPGATGSTASGSGAGGSGPGCAAGQTQCSGVCTETQTNASNCGTCGTACETGEVCSAGACQCQPGLTDCGGTCANTQSDGLHCGAACMACTGGQVCSLGACKDGCDAGLTQCGTSCVDVATDVLHCGGCNTACGVGQTCAESLCRCSNGQTRCGDLCVDTLNDPANCGGCGTACSSGSCSAGSCSTGSGGAGGSSGAGGSGGGGGGACTDIPPDDLYTCAQQVGWGKCNETWMVDHCNASCGRCTPGSGGSAGSGGSGGSGGAGGTSGSSGSGGSGGSDCGHEPVNPNATVQARKLLCYLYSQYGNHVLSGQQETSWDNPAADISWYADNGMGYPAIMGGDYLYPDGTTSRAQAYWNAGGITMIRYHMGAPPNSDTYQNSQGTANINNVLTDGTAENTSFKSKLDYVAAELQKLENANVPVLWAPFHEAQPNGWFWWSKGTGAQYVALWKYMYDYLTTTKGLNNLIWLMPFSGSPNAAFYPGKDYVDIAGPDTYETNQPFTSIYTATKNVVGTTIPIPLHETGLIPNPNNMFNGNAAPWVLFSIWASYQKDGQHNTTSNIQNVYANSYTVTRDEVPNLK